MAIIIGQQYEGIASWATPKAREFDDDSDDYLMIASADLPTLGLFDSDTPFTILATWYAGAFDDDHTIVGLYDGSLSNRLVWPRGQDSGNFKTFYNNSSQSTFGEYTTDTWYTAGLFCDGTGNGNGGSGSANFRTIVHNHATGEIVGEQSFSENNADSDLRDESDLKLGTYGSGNDPFTGALYLACCFVGIELTPSDLARFRVDPYAVISKYRAHCAWSPAPGELLGASIADTAPCPNIVPSYLGMEFKHFFGGSPSFTTRVAPSRPPEPCAIVVQSIAGAVVTCNQASVTVTGSDASGDPGAVTRTANQASVTVTGSDASGDPGAVTRTANQASVTVTGSDASGDPGAVTRTANQASVTVTGSDATGTREAGAQNATCNQASVLVTGLRASSIAGSISVQANFATSAVTSLAVTTTGGESIKIIVDDAVTIPAKVLDTVTIPAKVLDAVTLPNEV